MNHMLHNGGLRYCDKPGLIAEKVQELSLTLCLLQSPTLQVRDNLCESGLTLRQLLHRRVEELVAESVDARCQCAGSSDVSVVTVGCLYCWTAQKR